MKGLKFYEENDFLGAMHHWNCKFEEVHTYYRQATQPRWINSDDSINPDIFKEFDPEDVEELLKSYETFDFAKDYDALICDFQCFYNIDLTSEEVDLTRFLFLVNGLFSKEESVCAKRVGYRSFESNHNLDANYNNQMLKLKETYKLH